MPTTLESLHRAVIEAPRDHTVRLVYADALDETDDPTNTALAAFIRAQIELQTVPEPGRGHSELAIRCRELFEEHWLAWWRPVAAAARLPEPHVPRSRLRMGIVPTPGRRRRPKHWPYVHTASHGNLGVHLAEYGMSVRFEAGFPEEVRFNNLDTPENGPELAHLWGDAFPLARLAFSHAVTPDQWERVGGPHLGRLSDLTFDLLTPELAPAVAETPHLAALARLTVNPVGANTDAITSLVARPPWEMLRSLHFTGSLTPDAVRDFARYCTLEHLEELDLTLGNPGAIGNALGEVLNQLLRSFIHTTLFTPPDGPRWVDFGPALEVLAAAPWVRGLRRLRLASGQATRLLGLLGERLYGTAERGADLIPDAAVHALAAALNPDKLERLALPAAVIGPSAREELMTRLGERVAFA